MSFMKTIAALGAVAGLVSSIAACGDDKSDDANNTSAYAGHLYAATNASGSNAIVHYGRNTDGTLVQLETTTTGGSGIGGNVVVPGAPAPMAVDPLFSNDSLILSSDHDRVFVVNAGDGTVSALRADKDGVLTLVGRVATGGTTPTGLALHDDVLYVSHAAANTAGYQTFGFRVAADGMLTAIAGAAYAPSASTVVSHTLFSPNGEHLVVVELLAGVISVFPVNADGTLGAPVHNTSAAPGPFGATFVGDDTLLVTEAHPGEMNAGSVSAYSLASSGTLTVVSGNVVNGGNATCWISATPDKRVAFASNTTSGTVASYAIASNGALTLVNGSAAAKAANGATDFMGTPSSGPVDSVVSADGKYFYQQFSGLGIIGAYSVGASGTLTAIANGDGLGLPALGSDGIDGY